MGNKEINMEKVLASIKASNLFNRLCDFKYDRDDILDFINEIYDIRDNYNIDLEEIGLDENTIIINIGVMTKFITTYEDVVKPALCYVNYDEDQNGVEDGYIDIMEVLNAEDSISILSKALKTADRISDSKRFLFENDIAKLKNLVGEIKATKRTFSMRKKIKIIPEMRQKNVSKK